ncbi:hypothetical protein H5300_09805 [Vibrio sp. SG41-7]|uniref:hypothetical protein n=1 Tax=Vibrio TaxID=662 RepID=UPI001601F15C|nr:MULTISPECIES: hypothetical protein [Vibrio]MBB1463607.1 hypothetical protein [Vibrio sp. SG41-7]
MDQLKIEYLRHNIDHLTINELSEDLNVQAQDIIEAISQTDIIEHLISEKDGRDSDLLISSKAFAQ